MALPANVAAAGLGGRKMGRFSKILALVGALALSSGLNPAAAMSKPGFTHVIELDDPDVNLLNVYTKDGAEKNAFVGIVDLDGAPLVNFYAKADWAKFKAIWDEARKTTAPADGIDGIGGYSDGTHAIWIGVRKDGVLAFAIPQTADGTPDETSTWFFLKPEDAAALDKAFDRVSNYFAK
jgi:hypothetical protein